MMTLGPIVAGALAYCAYLKAADEARRGVHLQAVLTQKKTTLNDLSCRR